MVNVTRVIDFGSGMLDLKNIFGAGYRISLSGIMCHHETIPSSSVSATIIAHTGPIGLWDGEEAPNVTFGIGCQILRSETICNR